MPATFLGSAATALGDGRPHQYSHSVLGLKPDQMEVSTAHVHDNSQNTDIHIRISNFSCTIESSSASSGLRRLGPQKLFYLQLNSEGKKRRTSTTKSYDSPSWDEFIDLDVKRGKSLAIELFVQHSIRKEQLVGELALPFRIPANFGGRKDVLDQALINKKKRTGAITFHIERLHYSGEDEALRVDLADAGLKATSVVHKQAALGTVGAGLLEADSIAGELGSEYGIWKPLFDNVQFVVDIGDAIATIHPFAQIAWSAFSPVLKAIAQQVARDTNIGMLLDKMNDAYDFARRTTALGDLDEYRRMIITKMLQQTYDCSWLIRNYASRGFVKRGLNAVTTGHDKKVQLYIDSFTKLRERFQEGSLHEVEITVHRTLATVENISDLQLLSEMRCAHGYDPKNECLPGTRQAILTDIMEWIARDPGEEDRCVYWLHGVAGCGKSAIASSIVHYFRSLKRCVSFFFDASKQRDITPDRLFSTLSRNLADLDPQWSSSLVKALKESHELRTTSNIQRQFEDFILEPAKEFNPIGPILIVIDGIDESGSRRERALLLRMLGRLHELNRYGHFRFLIASRPEEDIAKVFSGQPWVFSNDLAAADTTATDDSIRRYVDMELSDNRYLLETWPTKPWVELIVSRAEHLFQWAFVACTFVNGDGSPGIDPVSRYEHLCRDTTSSRLDNLDQLYLTVLRSLFGLASQARSTDDRIPRLRVCLGRILSAREPLSMKALSSLRPDGEKHYEIELMIRPLGSLLNGVDKDDIPIQPLHASFIDFLSDETRSGEYHVGIGSQDGNLAKASLREMNKLLHFNICGLETSYLRNRDIEDLPTRLEKNIPEHLSYACRHFAEHLPGFWQDSDDLLVEIKRFMNDKLLFWLEILSLLGKMYVGFRSLQALRAWLQVRRAEKKVLEFVSDAERFSRVYNAVMATSAPHIYLSALTFAPRYSRVFQRYSERCAGMLRVDKKDEEKISWPSVLLSIKLSDRDNYITCSQFSPDGQRIVTGSYYGKVYVWDAHTGELVIGPFIGHSNSTMSVRFSPDGQRIVSGSDDTTVRVWDARTGELVVGPLTGHTDRVTSVRFSHDGQQIASGSDDMSIRVWDARTGDLIAGPFTGHTDSVRSVGFSPDNQRIVSGSFDMSIRVWDVNTGEIIVGPLIGHTHRIESVEFSPDGQRIVSGSWDRSVRVWDVRTGELTAGPFTGHTADLASVEFSPDGERIASGSSDKTVRIWDSRTGELVAGPFMGHTESITSIGFSPDGERIVSSSRGGATQVWDARTGTLVTGQSLGHKSSVRSVAFSPDGERIVSGSLDKSIRVWDVYTGKLVAGPFKGHTRGVTSVGFSPEGERIVSGSEDDSVRVWNSQTGELVAGPFIVQTKAGFLPGGQRIGSSIPNIAIHRETNHITSVGFSPDGQRIVSAAENKCIQVWDASTGDLVAGPFTGHTNAVRSVAFSPDGQQIASGSDDGSVRVWSAHTGELVAGPFMHYTSGIASIAFSPDGQQIASGPSYNGIRVWDIRTGKMIAASSPFTSHTDRITSIAFSPDGQQIVSGSWDRSVRVWDARTGMLVAGPFIGHTNHVTSVGFSPDGQRIVSGSDDNNVRVWSMNCNEAYAQTSPPAPLVPYTDSAEIDDNGWILGPSGELLLWIPNTYRRSLWRPSNTLVIGSNSLRLDCTEFLHGSEWIRCYQP